MKSKETVLALRSRVARVAAVLFLFCIFSVRADDLSVQGHYRADQLSRTQSGDEAPDWIVSNFTYPESTVSLVDLGEGREGLRLGNPNGKKAGRYTVDLRYPWSARPGFRHEVSMRFSADYGKQYTAMAGFSVRGPGTAFSVNLANGYCRAAQPWGDRKEVPDMTEGVKKVLGDWHATDLHTYTVKWTTTGDTDDVTFEVYVDGNFVTEMKGDYAPFDRGPTLAISFEYGYGTALIESVAWKMDPSDAVVRQLEEERGTWLLAARGPGSSNMRINDLMERIPENRTARFDFVWSKENYRLTEYPGEYQVSLYGAYLIAGVPYEAIGERLTSMVAKGVWEGATLLVMGGPYSFGKGGYSETPFEEILPVRSVGPFEVRMFEQPARMQPTQTAPPHLSFDPDNLPTVSFYHDINVTDDAEVLLTAAGKPILVRRGIGDGHAYAFLGFSAGQDANGYTSSKEWVRFLARILSLDQE